MLLHVRGTPLHVRRPYMSFVFGYYVRVEQVRGTPMCRLCLGATLGVEQVRVRVRVRYCAGVEHSVDTSITVSLPHALP